MHSAEARTQTSLKGGQSADSRFKFVCFTAQVLEGLSEDLAVAVLRLGGA